MDLNSVREFLGDDWSSVCRYIGDALKSDISLLEATNRSILSHSGKQIRPLIAILVARAISGGRCSDASYRYAAASELLHNATLLHDDVADNSDRRRGVPTIMSLMGPSVSVLVGDYWLVKAVRLILDDGGSAYRPIKIFSKTLCDLAEGEMLQLQKAQNCDTTEEDYFRIIYSKTASLFDAAARTAAISVCATEDVERAVCDYAVSLGLAFQIKDDIFDYMPSRTLGKPAGVDIGEQKITLPLLGAICNSGSGDEIRAMLCDIGGHPEYHDRIISFVLDNGGIDYARKRLDEYISKAVLSLGVLPDSAEKDYLVKLAYFVGDREQ